MVIQNIDEQGTGLNDKLLKGSEEAILRPGDIINVVERSFRYENPHFAAKFPELMAPVVNVAPVVCQTPTKFVSSGSVLGTPTKISSPLKAIIDEIVPGSAQKTPRRLLQQQVQTAELFTVSPVKSTPKKEGENSTASTPNQFKVTTLGVESPSSVQNGAQMTPCTPVHSKLAQSPVMGQASAGSATPSAPGSAATLRATPRTPRATIPGSPTVVDSEIVASPKFTRGEVYEYKSTGEAESLIDLENVPGEAEKENFQMEIDAPSNTEKSPMEITPTKMDEESAAAQEADYTEAKPEIVNHEDSADLMATEDKPVEISEPVLTEENTAEAETMEPEVEKKENEVEKMETEVIEMEAEGKAIENIETAAIQMEVEVENLELESNKIDPESNVEKVIMEAEVKETEVMEMEAPETALEEIVEEVALSLDDAIVVETEEAAPVQETATGEESILEVTHDEPKPTESEVVELIEAAEPVAVMEEAQTIEVIEPVAMEVVSEPVGTEAEEEIKEEFVVVPEPEAVTEAALEELKPEIETEPVIEEVAEPIAAEVPVEEAPQVEIVVEESAVPVEGEVTEATPSVPTEDEPKEDEDKVAVEAAAEPTPADLEAIAAIQREESMMTPRRSTRASSPYSQAKLSSRTPSKRSSANSTPLKNNTVDSFDDGEVRYVLAVPAETILATATASMEEEDLTATGSRRTTRRASTAAAKTPGTAGRRSIRKTALTKEADVPLAPEQMSPSLRKSASIEGVDSENLAPARQDENQQESSEGTRKRGRPSTANTLEEAPVTPRGKITKA